MPLNPFETQILHVRGEGSLFSVLINFPPNFKDRVAQICTSAYQKLEVLKLIGKFLTKQGKLIIYKSFVMSIFKHCPTAWPFCN